MTETSTIVKNPLTNIIFFHNNKWVMKLIDGEGIFFNREEFSDYSPDDFAKAVIEILEKEFNVKFENIV